MFSFNLRFLRNAGSPLATRPTLPAYLPFEFDSCVPLPTDQTYINVFPSAARGEGLLKFWSQGVCAAIAQTRLADIDLRHGHLYIVCWIALIASAVMYPMLCWGAVKGRGRVAAALGAVVFGSSGLFSGAILSGVSPWTGMLSLVYFGGVALGITLYVFFRVARSASRASAHLKQRMPADDGKTPD